MGLKMCSDSFSAAEPPATLQLTSGREVTATLLRPQGATSNSGLGLQRSSSEMETIRHLVSVIQTKLIVFWDNLNKNLIQDWTFVGTLWTSMNRYKFSLKEDGGICAWTIFQLVNITVLPGGHGSYHPRAGSGILTSNSVLEDTRLSTSPLKVHLLQKLKLCFTHLQWHVFVNNFFFQ